MAKNAKYEPEVLNRISLSCNSLAVGLFRWEPYGTEEMNTAQSRFHQQVKDFAARLSPCFQRYINSYVGNTDNSHDHGVASSACKPCARADEVLGALRQLSLADSIFVSQDVLSGRHRLRRTAVVAVCEHAHTEFIADVVLALNDVYVPDEDTTFLDDISKVIEFSGKMVPDHKDLPAEILVEMTLSLKREEEEDPCEEM